MADVTEAPPTAEPAPKKEKKVKPKPADVVIPPKKPKLSKAERRELQERQRAAKAAGGKPNKTDGSVKGGGAGDSGGKGGGKGGKDVSGATADKKGDKKSEDARGGEGGATRGGSEDKMVSLFSHLPPPKGKFLAFSLHDNVTLLSEYNGYDWMSYVSCNLFSFEQNFLTRVHQYVIEMFFTHATFKYYFQ